MTGAGLCARRSRGRHDTLGAPAGFPEGGPRFVGGIHRMPSMSCASHGLLLHGRLQRVGLRRKDVTENELRASRRVQGVNDGSGAGAVMLETGGTMSVIRAPLRHAGKFDWARGKNPNGPWALP